MFTVGRFCIADNRICTFYPGTVGAGYAWGTAMMMGHAHVFAHSVGFECSMLGGYAVDVHGAIAALSRNVFIQRIPCDTLHIVGMLSDFMHAFA